LLLGGDFWDREDKVEEREEKVGEGGRVGEKAFLALTITETALSVRRD
jgi:hypothetical protein